MRNGNHRAKWMPVEIEPFLSSAAVMAMKDFQRWWYMSLLLRAWQNVDRPCHVANDVELLWMLAGAESKEYFEKHSAIVIRQFVHSDDGQWLSNVKQLEVLANQIQLSEARKPAATKGGNVSASKRQAKVKQSSSKQSISTSDFASGSSSEDPEDWIQRIRSVGKWRDSDSAAVEHSFFEQVGEKQADPGKVLEAVARIYVATDSGRFAPRLAEVIRRWQEPIEFWGRSEPTKKDRNSQPQWPAYDPDKPVLRQCWNCNVEYQGDGAGDVYCTAECEADHDRDFAAAKAKKIDLQSYRKLYKGEK